MSNYETTFKNIDDRLWKDAGVNSEVDYAEQTSWLLFLKYLDDIEEDRAAIAELDGKDYTPILQSEYRWKSWAMPLNVKGELDHNKALTGDDLISFVNQDLFPYLKKFKQTAESTNTIEYKIGQIFGEVINKIQSGYVMRDVLDKLDELEFNSNESKHELSELYETRIKSLGNAGKSGGQYYTPRPLIRAMIQVIDPKLGETIYDGACGSGGFLCEAYGHLAPRVNSATDRITLQRETFYGQEKITLPFILGVMNMILHGIEAPNINHTNTLNENVMDIQPKDCHDIVLANPPFGGRERGEVQNNFPIQSSETAYLFLQHFIRKLKAGGRAAIVIKNTFLSNTDNASIALRKELLDSCYLHTILDCPAKTFLGAGVKTVVLFFERGRQTRDIWYYQLNIERSLGKTNPLNDADLAEFVALEKTKAESENSWRVNVADLDAETWDLSVKNPNTPEAAPLRAPEDIITDILTRDAETAQILEDIRGML